MKKRMIRLASFILAIAMILTSSSITSFADSTPASSDAEVISEVGQETEETVISDGEGEIAEDVTGDEEDALSENTEDVSGDEEGVSEDENESTDEDVSQNDGDVSENEETEELDVSDNNEELYDDTEQVTGSIAVTVGNKTVTYYDSAIMTYLSSDDFKNAENVKITLKTNVYTNTSLPLEGNTITLDLGKYTISSNQYTPAVVVSGNTNLTIKGSGKIERTKHTSTSSYTVADAALYICGGTVTLSNGTIAGMVGLFGVDGKRVTFINKGGKIISDIDAVMVGNGSTLEVTGGTLTGAKNGITILGESATAFVKGGTINAKCGIYMRRGNLYFSGGIINATKGGISLANEETTEAVNAYISGGTINSSEEGISISAEKGKVIQTAGNVNVNTTSDTVTACAVIQIAGEVYISGGNFKVNSAGNATGFCQYACSQAYAEISGSAKFTVDGAYTLGMLLFNYGDGNGSVDLKAGEFILGSTAKNSIDKEVVGICIGNITDNGYNGLETSGGKISINSSAKYIKGIYTNCLSKASFEQLDISIKATNADAAIGIDIVWNPAYQTIAGIPVGRSEEGTFGYNQLKFENSSLTISGNIRAAAGFYYNRARSGKAGNATNRKQINDNISISGSSISITSDSKELEALYGVYVDNSNGLIDEDGNTVDKDIAFSVSDSKISVSAGKNAKSDAAAELYGIYLNCAYVKNDVIIKNNTIDVSSGALTSGNSYGVEISGLYTNEDEIKFSADGNIVSLNAGKSDSAAYGFAIYADYTRVDELYCEFRNNTINLVGSECAVYGIDAFGHSLDISDGNYIYAKGWNACGVYTSKMYEATISGSQIKTIASKKNCGNCEAFGGYIVNKTTIENSVIYADADSSYIVPAINVRKFPSSPDSSLNITNSDITFKNPSFGQYAIVSEASSNLINKCNINSTAYGIKVTNGSTEITDSNISTQGKCFTGPTLKLGADVTLESKKDKVVGEDTTVEATKSEILAKDKSGLDVEFGSIKDTSYIKTVDDLNLSIELVIDGRDGSPLFSKGGKIGYKTSFNGDKYYSWSFGIDGWKIYNEDGSYTEFKASSVSGSNSALKIGSNIIELQISYALKNTETGESFQRTAVVTKEIILNPEVTLDARMDGSTSDTGRFIVDGVEKEEKIVVVPYDSLLTADDVPVKDGYIFTGWYVSEAGTDYEGHVIKDTTAVATYVPDGFYAKDASDKYITATNAKDQKSIQLDSEYYTGTAIKPGKYKFYYGKTELTNAKITYKNNVNVGEATITVTGDGKQFKGSHNLKFNIVKSPLSATSDNKKAAVAYTGKKIDFTPVLYNGKVSGVSPVKGKDYTVTYYYKEGTSENKVSEIKKPGIYRVACEGKGGYEGSVDISLKVSETITALTAKNVTVANHEFIGTSSPYLPGTGSYKDQVLVNGENVSGMLKFEYRIAEKGQEFYSATTINGVSVASKDFARIGTYEVRITGTNNGTTGFEGTVVKTYKITGTDISKYKATFTTDITKLVYDPIGNRTYKGIAVHKLEQRDTTISGSNTSIEFYYGKNKVEDLDAPIAAGKLTVVVTGKGQYYGSIKQTVTVKQYNIADAYKQVYDPIDMQKVSVESISSQVYKPGGVKEYPAVYVGDGYKKKALKSADLSYSFNNNTKAGTAAVTIKGVGNLTGSIKVNFQIIPASLGNISVIEAADRFASKKAGDYATSLSFNAGRLSLKAGTDYDKNVIYKDEDGNVLDSKSKISAGQKVFVTIYGKGNYYGARTVSFKVLRNNIAEAKFTAKSQVIHGEDVSPENVRVTLNINDLTATHKTYGSLTYGKDYFIVGYEKNDKAGTGYVIIRGTGAYEGTVKVPFKITVSDISKKRFK